MCGLLTVATLAVTANTVGAFAHQRSRDTTTLSSHAPKVLCIGETLWDSLPSGMFLGGAPSNVAMHLASLFDGSSNTVAVATCLGNDQLGKEAQRRLELKGVSTDYIQFHEDWETGMAIAIIDKNGDATYEFNTPAAWDGLVLEDQLATIINNEEPDLTKIFIMGTIAARLQSEKGATSASTLTAVRNNARGGSVVLDVNLRSPWYNPQSILELARGVDSENANKLALLKLNEDELVILEDWCGLKSDGNELTGSKLKNRMRKLASSLNSQRVCVTRGADGAALWCESTVGDDGIFHENSGYQIESSDGDTVGAGDAFLAALVNSLFMLNESSSTALQRACALGGYVAGCRGATPDHDDAPFELRHIFQFCKVS